MVASGRRVKARINAAEKDLQVGTNNIGTLRFTAARSSARVGLTAGPEILRFGSLFMFWRGL